MDMPEVEKLHKLAIERLEGMRDGRTREGFGSLIDAARYIAVAEVCAAIRKDLKSLLPKEEQ